MANDKFFLELSANFKEFTDAMKKAGDVTNSTLFKISESVSKTNLSLASLAGELGAKAISKGFELIASGVESAIVFLDESVHAAAESEKALKQLNISLQQTGIYTKETSKEFKDFAELMQKTANIEDDLVLSQLALLQNLGKFSKDGLKQAFRAAADLSVGLRIDLESAIRLVGKAAQGEIGTFSRYGIVIKKGADDASTFAGAIEAINERFGGQAAKNATDFASKVEILTNTWSDFKEEIGSVITQNESFKKALEFVTELVENMKESVSKMSPVFGDLLTKAVENTIMVFKSLLDLVGPIISAFKLATQFVYGFASVWDFLTGLIPGLFKLISDVLVPVNSHLSKMFGLISNVFGAFNSLFSSVKAVSGTIIDAIDASRRSMIKTGLDGLDVIERFKTAGQGMLQTQQQLDSQNKSSSTSTKEWLTQLENAKKSLEDIQKRFAKADFAATYQKEVAAIEFLISAGIAKRQDYYGVLLKLKQEYEAKVAEQDAQIEAKKLEKTQSELDASQERFDLILEQGGLNRDTELQAEIDKNKAILASGQLTGKEQIAYKKKIREQEKAIQQGQIADQQAFFSKATSLAQSENQTLKSIGKAAALTSIAIDTPPAVASSFRFGAKIGGPPVGAIFAGIALAAQLEQAKKVAALATGITNVPGPRGRDQFPALLAGGERVVTTAQNQDLTRFLSENNGSNQLLAAIVDRLDRLENTYIVNIGNREIVREVQRGINEGRVLEVG